MAAQLSILSLPPRRERLADHRSWEEPTRGLGCVWEDRDVDGKFSPGIPLVRSQA